MIWTLLCGSFFLSMAATSVMVLFAPRLGFIDPPGDRSSHLVPTPRGGGVGLVLVTAASAGLLGVPIIIWLSAIFISIVSLCDDWRGVPPLVRLLCHFFAATIALPALVPPDMEVAQYAILGLFWLWFLVVTANFFNFMDGINGMAGLSGTVGFGLLAFFAYLHDADSWQFILPICLAAACLGFLPFNFPRARIFFGDVGSILIGFLFALLVAVLAVDISSFLILAGCLLPIYADASFTLFYRWRRQENLLVAHRQHLYQMLVHTGGFPHWQVSLFYALLQLITGLFLIVGEKAWGEGFVIALFLTIILGFLVFGISVRRGALGVPTLFSLEAKK